MTPEIIAVLCVVAGALLLFLTERPRIDLVAVLVLLTLAISGLVTPLEAIAGFSNPVVVTVCAIFVLSAGLQRTGVATLIGRRLFPLAGKSEVRLVLVVMVTAAFMSFFMNTVGIVALMLPVVMDLARRTGRPPSKLLMPLAFASLLGGLTTLFATMPNILVSNALRDAGLRPFGVLDYLPVGAVAATAGILFVALAGRRWLPARDLQKESSHLDMMRRYDLHERMFVLRLPPDSVLAGRTLEESRLGSALGLHVAAVIRSRETLLAPLPSFVMRGADRLLVQGTPDELKNLRMWRQLSIDEDSPALRQWFPEETAFADVRIAPDSPLAAQTLAWSNFRRHHGVNVLAIRRGSIIRRSRLQDWMLRPGDILLVHGQKEQVSRLSDVAGLEDCRSVEASELNSVYKMEKRMFSITVPAESRLVDRTLKESRLGDALGLTVLAIEREEKRQFMPSADEVLRAGDRLLMAGRAEDLSSLRGLQNLEMERELPAGIEQFESERIGWVEAILSPRSSLVGRSLREIQFRQTHEVTVLGIWREGRTLTQGLRDARLQLGDALLLWGPHEKLKQIARNPDFVVLSEAIQEPPLFARAPLAAIAMLIFLLPALLGWLPLHIAAMLGAAAMVLFRCLQMDDVYRAVDWRAIILIAGMMPLATAMQTTGAATWIADGLVSQVGPAGPLAVVGALVLVTVLGGCVIPSVALVLLMAPIALQTAAEMGFSPHSAMMALAMAASASFLSPISHPANVMIMGPGGYRFADFFRLGIPLAIVVMTVVLLVLPVFWPFYP